MTRHLTPAELAERIGLSPDRLPMRLTTPEVCSLARYSRTKLAAQVKSGAMPKPVDTGRPNIFNRDEVLRALGLLTTPTHPVDQEMTDDARNFLLARKLRHRSKAGQRNAPSPIRGAASPPALRLVGDHAPATGSRTP